MTATAGLGGGRGGGGAGPTVRPAEEGTLNKLSRSSPFPPALSHSPAAALFLALLVARVPGRLKNAHKLLLDPWYSLTARAGSGRSACLSSTRWKVASPRPPAASISSHCSPSVANNRSSMRFTRQSQLASAAPRFRFRWTLETCGSHKRTHLPVGSAQSDMMEVMPTVSWGWAES